MGLPWCTWMVMASVWCFSTSSAYNLDRLAEERGQPVNVGVDFFSTAETDEFIDFSKKHSEEHMPKLQTSTPSGSDSGRDSTPLDSWSVVWYVASFGGLVIFFLIVSCSEWCCRRALRDHRNCGRVAASNAAPSVPDTPPPSYEQFAPPSYESICLGRTRGEKSEYDIYVVPVHTLGTLVQSSRAEDAPPSYLSASGGTTFVPALTRLENNRVT